MPVTPPSSTDDPRPPDRVDDSLAAARMRLCARICELGITEVWKVSAYVTQLAIEADYAPDGTVIPFKRRS